MTCLTSSTTHAFHSGVWYERGRHPFAGSVVVHAFGGWVALVAVLLLIFLLLVVQASDVLQYICGKLFGKHRMVPAISPKKSWEGFAGSVICGTTAAVLADSQAYLRRYLRNLAIEQYSDGLVPGLAHSIVAMNSLQIATAHNAGAALLLLATLALYRSLRQG